MTIEDEVTGGLVTWLEGFRYDRARGVVEFRAAVLGPAGFPLAVRRVTFNGVREYAEEPFDAAVPFDPTVLEGLVGLDAHARDQATWYVIHTTEREVTFYDNSLARVESLDGESDEPAS